MTSIKVRYLLCIIAGLLISNTSGIYARIKVETWFETHSPNQGMPSSLDLEIAEFIERPIDYIWYHLYDPN